MKISLALPTQMFYSVDMKVIPVNLVKKNNVWHAVWQAGPTTMTRSTLTSDRDTAVKIAHYYHKEFMSDRYDDLADVLARIKGSATMRQIANWYWHEPLDVKESTKRRNLWAFEHLVRELNLGMKSRCEELTERKVKTWLLAQPNATTANSILMQARSVVSKCPYRPPGLLIAPARAERKVYQWPQQEELDRLLAASRDWQQQDPKVFLAWGLASNLGLRAGEIVNARWDWLSGDTLTVQEGHGFRIKNRSQRSIPVPQWLRELLASTPRENDYILGESCVTNRKAVIRRLNAAMRKAGWRRRMCAHELRKLFGAQVATQAGVFVAARLLGNGAQVADQVYTGISQQPSYQLMH